MEEFGTAEVSKLKTNDGQKARRIFRRFLEQASEVICAAGVADPCATTAIISTGLNMPLLAMAPSPDLKA
eukprot:4228571-Amphidinium_carterae.1